MSLRVRYEVCRSENAIIDRAKIHRTYSKMADHRVMGEGVWEFTTVCHGGREGGSKSDRYPVT